jgi:hypothetical protein
MRIPATLVLAAGRFQDLPLFASQAGFALAMDLFEDPVDFILGRQFVEFVVRLVNPQLGTVG